jgi:hypothetical protein
LVEHPFGILKKQQKQKTFRVKRLPVAHAHTRTFPTKIKAGDWGKSSLISKKTSSSISSQQITQKKINANPFESWVGIGFRDS